MKKQKPYKSRSLPAAERRVRELKRQVHYLNDALGRRMNDCKTLAMLAAEGPCFDNPLHAMAAKAVRDRELKECGLNPDGTRFGSVLPAKETT